MAERLARCPVTKKVKFTEKVDALLVIYRGQIRDNGRRREKRAYWCGHCQSWHLTSQPERRRDPPA